MGGDEACFESTMSKRSMSDGNAEILEERGEGNATCGGSDNLGMFLQWGDAVVLWDATCSHKPGDLSSKIALEEDHRHWLHSGKPSTSL
jgi:nitrite reductase/ring-hydroxylating ferredoxin subunit